MNADWNRLKPTNSVSSIHRGENIQASTTLRQMTAPVKARTVRSIDIKRSPQIKVLQNISGTLVFRFQPFDAKNLEQLFLVERFGLTAAMDPQLQLEEGAARSIHHIYRTYL